MSFFFLPLFCSYIQYSPKPPFLCLIISQSWSDHTCVTGLPNRGNQQWFNKQVINQWCTEACNTCQSKPIKFKVSPLNSTWVGWPCGGQPDMPCLRGQWPAWRINTKIMHLPDYQAHTGSVIIWKIFSIVEKLILILILILT